VHHLESKDYEFSRSSVLERWAEGRQDVRACIEHPDWLKPTDTGDAVTVYDLLNPHRYRPHD
jgi:NTE family protein